MEHTGPRVQVANLQTKCLHSAESGVTGEWILSNVFCFSNGGYKMADIRFEIKNTLGVLSESTKGWKKELNFMSWNDKEAKYDLREWAPEHEKMGKGITLSREELVVLREILNGMDL